jgi:hypothetical protein
MTELLSVLVILNVYIACENIAEIFFSTMELYYYGSESMSSHIYENLLQAQRFLTVSAFNSQN